MVREKTLDATNVSRSLARWCREAEPTERRTVVLRVRASADLRRLAEALERHNDHVESAGGRVVTAVVSVGGLSAVSSLSEVLAVDEPRDLHLFKEFGESNA